MFILYYGTKKDDLLIEYIMQFINTSKYFLPIFTHHKQIYKNEILFKALLYKLKTGIAYNNIKYFKIKDLAW